MDYSIARRLMVEQQVIRRGVSDPLVVDAMMRVPRHLFVEEALWSQAYSDFPLPIGEKQTISQPFMVAFMTESLCLHGGEKVLEIGTGSGYQAAVLSQIVSRVYTVERLPGLARRARRILDSVGCRNVNIKLTDGTFGWEEESPFDGIVVTAGSPQIPHHYLEQLAVGGRLVIPVGNRGSQVLKRVVRTGVEKFSEEDLLDCRFVPLVGKYGWHEEGD
ncbi:protein-L-isoaspartate O-methyltransferase [Syntrophotalea carbinolica DSM 2380]|uniref:Protein-L-isoaspartate O-methyltransferase n=1 Tax=Syntrophotalea carbinolica (strain DSM 2380 / NBRC 103641 / GraBd1) TaxID=338963 RepID=PIMT_SYNC1|nr:protein-L-isoaspartate(D-aspartate) O-methyltransferase [Syntrophotalea carbinolica]Q3A4N4.1 RecName: Full=Protein-L-isoaspartate O-methyltransferase; AltName: Full=L-isoaspartyl protein carboxyl methyltransferase; AltName: Full=Protein L-isoaspartyl methyltransferase; AltName: Full=Protein-beta-aspartate methyltransferase; Short=PIMT [Syntrophotalea carbinolica DSM 2380]ABA88673.1 protein-L-isoaspartate O-methyltransferase [Syntrophotalea carbinolica DSM 2380]